MIPLHRFNNHANAISVLTDEKQAPGDFEFCTRLWHLRWHFIYVIKTLLVDATTRFTWLVTTLQMLSC
ncbi:hypothetical protein O9992_01915 [Vibrio lentus]|nr:hypothetical protein [Vibrio lentus]